MSSLRSRFKRGGALIGSAVALSLVFVGAAVQSAQAATSYTIVAAITTGGGGNSTMVVDETHGRLYAADYQQSLITVIDTSTNEVIGEIPTPPTPQGVAVDETRNVVWVANTGGATVTAYDGVTFAEIAEIPVPTAYYLRYDEASDHVFVTSLFSSSSVTVIDAGTYAVLDPVTAGQAPGQLETNPARGELYVANNGDSTMSIIDTASSAVLKTVTLPAAPKAITADVASSKVYVALADDTVVIVDPEAGAVVDTLEGFATPRDVEVDSERGRLFVSSLFGQLTVFDTATGNLVQTVNTVSNTWKLAINPADGDVFATGITDPIYRVSLLTLPEITSAAPVAGVVGTAYTHTVTATGSPDVTLSIGDGDLPPGLTFDAASGILAGTPTTEGSYTFTVTATNPAGATSASYTVDVYTAPAITSDAPKDGVTGTAYLHTVTATGTGPLEYSISDGALPEGLTLDAKTGTISGTPTTIGEYSFTIAVTGPGGTVTQQYDLDVVAAATLEPPATEAPTEGSALAHTGFDLMAGSAAALAALAGGLIAFLVARRRKAVE